MHNLVNKFKFAQYLIAILIAIFVLTLIVGCSGDAEDNDVAGTDSTFIDGYHVYGALWLYADSGVLLKGHNAGEANVKLSIKALKSLVDKNCPVAKKITEIRFANGFSGDWYKDNVLYLNKASDKESYITDLFAC